MASLVTESSSKFSRLQLQQHLDDAFLATAGVDVGVKMTDGNNGFLRAARAGNLEKVLEHLRNKTDINTCNANGLNAVHLAAKEGHVSVVTELLSRGANVDGATKKGNTALHIASLAGQEEIVKILVQHNAKINIQSQNGFTPLYMAAQENHAEVVKFLLSNGANQTLATEDGFTPLAVALQQGHDRVVAVLLENDSRGRLRLPALHIAAKKDDLKAATLLLQNDSNAEIPTSKNGGSLVNETTKSGFTPIHIAAHYGNTHVGRLLIEKGSDVNFKARNNITPLHVSSKWGRTNMVILLLDSHADTDSKTRDGLTPLHCAARSGHDQVVDVLLERGACVTSKTKNGLTPLHMATQGDHLDCVRLLLYHNAPIDDVTIDYLTPLHVAAHCGNVKTARLLLERKCEVDARALNGFTPLHIACKKNRIPVVELLLKYGASIEATTESGLTPLHVGSFMGHMNAVMFLLQSNANPNNKTVRGETPLHLAARANQTDIIRILLRNGAEVDARAREQQSPLHIAARLGNVDTVMLLLQHGAMPDSTTSDLQTPLHVAAKEGHEEVVQALLDQGANPNLLTKMGFTPLHIAAKYGNIEVARLLLEKNVSPDAEGKNGLTPLHVATHYSHANVALLLLKKGATPHSTAKNGYTALHVASKKNQMNIASALLEHGAKPDAESKNGFTPLHLASQHGFSDMVSLLIESGANPNSKSNNGLTPMHLAAQEDKVPVAQVLVRHKSQTDAQTKAGYTPLHTACHFGQINMIRFLLEQNASVSSTTKMGYTPLHQASQQGHVLVVNLLLKYHASPDALTYNGQTPLSIAQKLGYISVVELLRNVTKSTALPSSSDDKYKVVSPETMQEAPMSDSEDEGEEPVLGDIAEDDMKMLHDDSIIPVKDDQRIIQRKTAAQLYSAMDSTPGHHYATSVNSPLKAPVSDTDSRIYGSSYSGVSFASCFNIDNIAVDKLHQTSHLKWKNFLVSFMVDARGGAMSGCRHSGVRIIIPPGRASMPTRIICKLVKKEKLSNPPPLMESEALASRILEMRPVGTQFLGPVIIEVPHLASLRGREREICILRSDDGQVWQEHTMDASDEAVRDALGGSFEDLGVAEEHHQRRVARILTTDLPQYFAVITRIRQQSNGIGIEGGVITSTVIPQVKAIFPEGSLTKNIKVGLQTLPVSPELVSKMLGNRVAVSPIVTVEPRRRKFHKPITLTVPLPKASQKGMLNQYGSEAPTLRLLCSLMGGTSPAQWEDITGTTPLTFVNDCVSFTTSVSARFWLMDCQNISEASKMATELYREVIAVPFMSKFVAFAKRHEMHEAYLRIFCMTDDKTEKTLEFQEQFHEVARSRDVEVLEGKQLYLEMGGNLVPVTKSGEQLCMKFRSFHENRLPFVVRIRDSSEDPVGRMAFMQEPKVARGEAPLIPICNLNITLPEQERIDATEQESPGPKVSIFSATEDVDAHATRHLPFISDMLDSDWVMLSPYLNLTDKDFIKIQMEYPYSRDQARAALQLWGQSRAAQNAAENLRLYLIHIGRVDIVAKHLATEKNVSEVNKELNTEFRPTLSHAYVRPTVTDESFSPIKSPPKLITEDKLISSVMQVPVYGMDDTLSNFAETKKSQDRKSDVPKAQPSILQPEKPAVTEKIIEPTKIEPTKAEIIMDSSYNEDKGFWESDYDHVPEQQTSFQPEQSMIESSIQISPSPSDSFIIVRTEDLVSTSSSLQASTDQRVSAISKDRFVEMSGEDSFVCIHQEVIEKAYSPTDAVSMSAQQGEHIPQSLPYPEREILSSEKDSYIAEHVVEGSVTYNEEKIRASELDDDNILVGESKQAKDQALLDATLMGRNDKLTEASLLLQEDGKLTDMTSRKPVSVEIMIQSLPADTLPSQDKLEGVTETKVSSNPEVKGPTHQFESSDEWLCVEDTEVNSPDNESMTSDFDARCVNLLLEEAAVDVSHELPEDKSNLLSLDTKFEIMDDIEDIPTEAEVTLDSSTAIDTIQQTMTTDNRFVVTTENLLLPEIVETLSDIESKPYEPGTSGETQLDEDFELVSVEECAVEYLQGPTTCVTETETQMMQPSFEILKEKLHEESETSKSLDDYMQCSKNGIYKSDFEFLDYDNRNLFMDNEVQMPLTTAAEELHDELSLTIEQLSDETLIAFPEKIMENGSFSTKAVRELHDESQYDLFEAVMDMENEISIKKEDKICTDHWLKYSERDNKNGEISGRDLLDMKETIKEEKQFMQDKENLFTSDIQIGKNSSENISVNVKVDEIAFMTVEKKKEKAEFEMFRESSEEKLGLESIGKPASFSGHYFNLDTQKMQVSNFTETHEQCSSVAFQEKAKVEERFVSLEPPYTQVETTAILHSNASQVIHEMSLATIPCEVISPLVSSDEEIIKEDLEEEKKRRSFVDDLLAYEPKSLETALSKELSDEAILPENQESLTPERREDRKPHPHNLLSEEFLEQHMHIDCTAIIASAEKLALEKEQAALPESRQIGLHIVQNKAQPVRAQEGTEVREFPCNELEAQDTETLSSAEEATPTAVEKVSTKAGVSEQLETSDMEVKSPEIEAIPNKITTAKDIAGTGPVPREDHEEKTEIPSSAEEMITGKLEYNETVATVKVSERVLPPDGDELLAPGERVVSETEELEESEEYDKEPAQISNVTAVATFAEPRLSSHRAETSMPDIIETEILTTEIGEELIQAEERISPERLNSELELNSRQQLSPTEEVSEAKPSVSVTTNTSEKLETVETKTVSPVADAVPLQVMTQKENAETEAESPMSESIPFNVMTGKEVASDEEIPMDEQEEEELGKTTPPAVLSDQVLASEINKSLLPEERDVYDAEEKTLVEFGQDRMKILDVTAATICAEPLPSLGEEMAIISNVLDATSAVDEKASANSNISDKLETVYTEAGAPLAQTLSLQTLTEKEVSSDEAMQLVEPEKKGIHFHSEELFTGELEPHRTAAASLASADVPSDNLEELLIPQERFITKVEEKPSEEFSEESVRFSDVTATAIRAESLLTPDKEETSVMKITEAEIASAQIEEVYFQTEERALLLDLLYNEFETGNKEQLFSLESSPAMVAKVPGTTDVSEKLETVDRELESPVSEIVPCKIMADEKAIDNEEIWRDELNEEEIQSPAEEAFTDELELNEVALSDVPLVKVLSAKIEENDLIETDKKLSEESMDDSGQTSNVTAVETFVEPLLTVNVEEMSATGIREVEFVSTNIHEEQIQIEEGAASSETLFPELKSIEVDQLSAVEVPESALPMIEKIETTTVILEKMETSDMEAETSDEEIQREELNEEEMQSTAEEAFTGGLESLEMEVPSLLLDNVLVADTEQSSVLKEEVEIEAEEKSEEEFGEEPGLTLDTTAVTSFAETLLTFDKEENSMCQIKEVEISSVPIKEEQIQVEERVASPEPWCTDLEMIETDWLSSAEVEHEARPVAVEKISVASEVSENLETVDMKVESSVPEAVPYKITRDKEVTKDVEIPNDEMTEEQLQFSAKEVFTGELELHKTAVPAVLPVEIFATEIPEFEETVVRFDEELVQAEDRAASPVPLFGKLNTAIEVNRLSSSYEELYKVAPAEVEIIPVTTFVRGEEDAVDFKEVMSLLAAEDVPLQVVMEEEVVAVEIWRKALEDEIDPSKERFLCNRESPERTVDSLHSEAVSVTKIDDSLMMEEEDVIETEFKSSEETVEEPVQVSHVSSISRFAAPTLAALGEEETSIITIKETEIASALDFTAQETAEDKTQEEGMQLCAHEVLIHHMESRETACVVSPSNALAEEIHDSLMPEERAVIETEEKQSENFLEESFRISDFAAVTTFTEPLWSLHKGGTSIFKEAESIVTQMQIGEEQIQAKELSASPKALHSELEAAEVQQFYSAVDLPKTIVKKSEVTTSASEKPEHVDMKAESIVGETILDETMSRMDDSFADEILGGDLEEQEIKHPAEKAFADDLELGRITDHAVVSAGEFVAEFQESLTPEKRDQIETEETLLDEFQKELFQSSVVTSVTTSAEPLLPLQKEETSFPDFEEIEVAAAPFEEGKARLEERVSSPEPMHTKLERTEMEQLSSAEEVPQTIPFVVKKHSVRFDISEKLEAFGTDVESPASETISFEVVSRSDDVRSDEENVLEEECLPSHPEETLTGQLEPFVVDAAAAVRLGKPDITESLVLSESDMMDVGEKPPEESIEEEPVCMSDVNAMITFAAEPLLEINEFSVPDVDQSVIIQIKEKQFVEDGEIEEEEKEEEEEKKDEYEEEEDEYEEEEEKETAASLVTFYDEFIKNEVEQLSSADGVREEFPGMLTKAFVDTKVSEHLGDFGTQVETPVVDIVPFEVVPKKVVTFAKEISMREPDDDEISSFVEGVLIDGLESHEAAALAECLDKVKGAEFEDFLVAELSEGIEVEKLPGEENPPSSAFVIDMFGSFQRASPFESFDKSEESETVFSMQKYKEVPEMDKRASREIQDETFLMSDVIVGTEFGEEMLSISNQIAKASELKQTEGQTEMKELQTEERVASPELLQAEDRMVDSTELTLAEEAPREVLCPAHKDEKAAELERNLLVKSEFQTVPPLDDLDFETHLLSETLPVTDKSESITFDLIVLSDDHHICQPLKAVDGLSATAIFENDDDGKIHCKEIGSSDDTFSFDLLSRDLPESRPSADEILKSMPILFQDSISNIFLKHHLHFVESNDSDLCFEEKIRSVPPVSNILGLDDFMDETITSLGLTKKDQKQNLQQTDDPIREIMHSVAPDGENLDGIVKGDPCMTINWSLQSSICESLEKSKLFLEEFVKEDVTIADTVQEGPPFETEIKEYEDTPRYDTVVQHELVQSYQNQETITEKIVVEGPEEELKITRGVGYEQWHTEVKADVEKLYAADDRVSTSSSEVAQLEDVCHSQGVQEGHDDEWELIGEEDIPTLPAAEYK